MESFNNVLGEMVKTYERLFLIVIGTCFQEVCRDDVHNYFWKTYSQGLKTITLLCIALHHSSPLSKAEKTNGDTIIASFIMFKSVTG
jgi:hypothetical protein